MNRVLTKRETDDLRLFSFLSTRLTANLHNLPGYFLSYYSSRLSLSLSEYESRRREPERDRFSSHMNGHCLVEIQDIGNFHFSPRDDFFFD